MPLDSQPAPPLYPLTENDHTALAVIASLIFLIYAIIGIVLKLIIRLNITSLKSHDALLLVSVVLLFIQTIVTIAACNNGLGRHQDFVESSGLEAFYRLTYASSILAVAAAATTKLALCLLIQSINNHGRFHIANMVLLGVVVAWAVSGIFALAFQCSRPQPWRAISLERCPGRETIYLYNSVLDIITDFTLCIFPIAMMWKVRTPLRRKLMVIALFGTRIIVPIVSIPGLVSTQRFASNYTDATWHAVPHVIWLQCSLGLSILTACVPSLKGVIDSLLGSTSVAAIQAPYQLTTSGTGKGSRLRATALGSGSNSDQGSRSAGGAGDSRAKSLRHSEWARAAQTAQAAYSSGAKEKEKEKADSVRKLTEGNEDFEIHGDDGGESSSQEDSWKASEARYHM